MAAKTFDVGTPTIWSNVTAGSEPQDLPGRSSLLILLMAIHLISAIASAQAPPAQSPETAGSSGAPTGGAQSSTTAPSAADTPANQVPSSKTEKKKKEKRGKIVAAPIPISNAALGTGIIPVVSYIFALSKEDKISPPSVVGAAGLITDNGSRALALAGQLYVKHNTSIITAAFVRGHLNYDFYGTGSAAGDAGRKLALTQTGQLFFGEFLHRIGWKFFLGPRVWIASSSITPHPDSSTADQPVLSALDLGTSPRALGLRLLRDTRPNRFYATAGTLFDFKANFFQVDSASSGLPGGNKTYSFQPYELTFNKYMSLSKSQVLAYNLTLCAVGGQAPFYGQCLFGTKNELRGYVPGRYIDTRMFATQLEYRLALPKRLGLVAFGGVGEVAPSLGKFNGDNLLPAIGAGLRFLLDRKYHVNFRIDFAQGKNEHTWSMGIAEAF